jgi:hypothetical protein
MLAALAVDRLPSTVHRLPTTVRGFSETRGISWKELTSEVGRGQTKYSTHYRETARLAHLTVDGRRLTVDRNRQTVDGYR